MVSDITVLLQRWNQGSIEAGEAVIAQTYEQLRRLARAKFRGERAGHTLQATALLNEVYLRLLPQGPRAADNKDAFFRLMAVEMQRRLIDHARRRLADKRGGGVSHEPVDAMTPALVTDASSEAALLDRLDLAVAELAASHPRAGEVVQLRYIAGLTVEEIAETLGLSPSTVKREWTFAKAWLAAALE